MNVCKFAFLENENSKVKISSPPNDTLGKLFNMLIWINNKYQGSLVICSIFPVVY